MVPVTDAKETHKSLDLALRIGEILLSSGAGAADVTATMLAIAQHLGIRNPDVDVTFTSLRMAHVWDPDEPAVSVSRTITQRDIDYDDLTRTQHLVDDLFSERIDRDEARARVARLTSTGHWAPRWAVVLASAVIGGGVAMILGGGPVVILAAALAGAGIDLLTRRMSRSRWPMFYQQAAGGLFASLIAVGAAALDLEADPSHVITASIVLLLSGIGFMGAIQDALSGFYVTAGARILEAMMATAGLIAGVTAGLGLAPILGVRLGQVTPGDIGLGDVPFILVGAVVSAVAFGFTVYAPLRALPAIGATTLIGHVVFVLTRAPGGDRPAAAAFAAVAIGVVSYSVAGRVRVPPLVVVVPALVPMLPGLSILRGLSAMQNGSVTGVLNLSTAAATTIALAAGVILGEYIAQPLKRNARRMETRLAGPRMVGVQHGQLRRARREVRRRRLRVHEAEHGTTDATQATRTGAREGQEDGTMGEP